MQLERWWRRAPLELNVRPHDSAPHLKRPAYIREIKSPVNMIASKCLICMDVQTTGRKWGVGVRGPVSVEITQTLTVSPAQGCGVTGTSRFGCKAKNWTATLNGGTLLQNLKRHCMTLPPDDTLSATIRELGLEDRSAKKVIDGDSKKKMGVPKLDSES
jgi:hypothetical protein